MENHLKKDLEHLVDCDRLLSAIEKNRNFTSKTKVLDSGCCWAAGWPDAIRDNSSYRRQDSWIEYVGCESGQIIWVILEG